MKKHFFLLAFLFFAKVVTCQVVKKFEDENYVHVKINELIMKSMNVAIPDSVLLIFKDYQVFNNLSKNFVDRNKPYCSVLLNISLSVDDRIFFCDYLSLTNKGIRPSSFPLEFLANIRKKLLTNK